MPRTSHLRRLSRAVITTVVALGLVATATAVDASAAPTPPKPKPNPMTLVVPVSADAYSTVTITTLVPPVKGSPRRYVTMTASRDGTNFAPVTRWLVTGRGRKVVVLPAGASVGRLWIRTVLGGRGLKPVTRNASVKITNPYRPSAPDNIDIPEAGVPVTAQLFGNHPIDGVPEAAGTVRLWDTATSWNKVEPNRGQYNWSLLDRDVAQAEAAGQQVLLTLGGTPEWAAVGPAPGPEFAGEGSSMPMGDAAWFEDYVRAVVRRYGSRIQAYQIWNEANIDQFWRGTPELMADLTGRAYRVIHQYQPNAIVVAASTGSRWVKGFADFYPQYLTALGNLNWPIDAFSVHLYPRADGTPTDRLYLLGLMRTALRIANAPPKPIWETEINYGVTNPGLGESARAIPDSAVPAYVARTYLDSLRYGIARSYWYAWTPDYKLLGIQMWTGYPAARAYRAIRDWLVGSTFNGCSDAGAVVTCNFNRNRVPFYVVYTQDGSTGSAAVPRGMTTATTLDGVASPVSAQVQVSGTPIRLS